jgi:hypothetical protein
MRILTATHNLNLLFLRPQITVVELGGSRYLSVGFGRHPHGDIGIGSLRSRSPPSDDFTMDMARRINSEDGLSAAKFRGNHNMMESPERMVETDISTAAPRSKSFQRWKHVFGLVFAS